MRLSPLDIKKQSFSKKMRGIDNDEVQAFLEMASGQWEDVLDDNRRLEDRVREMESKLDHYEKVEEALQEALQTARESSEQRLKNASDEAGVIKKDAESEARHIVHDAREERERSRQEAENLAHKTSELTTRLRSFLQSELEMLDRFQSAGPAQSARKSPAQSSAATASRQQASAPKEVAPGNSTTMEEEERSSPPTPVKSPAQNLPSTNEGGSPASEEPESEELEKIRRILSDLD